MIRPTLRSGVVLIDRPDDSVLVSPTRLVIPALTAAERRWLADLNGMNTQSELLHYAPSARAPQFLVALREAGALTDASELPSLVRACTAMERLAVLDERDTLALALGAQHADAIVLRRRQIRLAVVGDGLIADGLRAGLHQLGFAASRSAPMLTVLASQGHVDVFDDDGCTSLDQPHLQVRAIAHRARVGPLVLPGHTSCLRCAHAYSTDADPLWPVTSLRLARATRNQELRNPALIHATIASALAMVCAWADDGKVSTNTSMEFSLPGPTQTQVHRPRHPMCGCAWEQPGRGEIVDSG